jgi:hypothetical protein
VRRLDLKYALALRRLYPSSRSDASVLLQCLELRRLGAFDVEGHCSEENLCSFQAGGIGARRTWRVFMIQTDSKDSNRLPLWETSELEDSMLHFAAGVWLGLELGRMEFSTKMER